MQLGELLGQIFADGQTIPDGHLAGQQYGHAATGRVFADAVGSVGLVSSTRTSWNGMPKAVATHGRIDHDE
jgi:hypothetical protein